MVIAAPLDFSNLPPNDHGGATELPPGEVILPAMFRTSNGTFQMISYGLPAKPEGKSRRAKSGCSAAHRSKPQPGWAL